MTLEDGRRRYDGEPKRPKYPTELVHRYGAKAGLLMYVARELSDIPQMSMVVNESGESNAHFLRRAKEAGIGWPRFFRSSAVVELDGYEGVFPTEEVEAYEVGHERVKWNSLNYSLFRNQEYFDDYTDKLINIIKTSPQRLKADGRGLDLPDEINVIIAEKSPSRYFGTYIKHPNRDNYYLMAVTDAETQGFTKGPRDNPQRNDYECTTESGISLLGHYAPKFGLDDSPVIRRDLETVAQWHDRIVALPDLDPAWTYQLEFGIDPVCLYQVRPFKAVSRASFRIEESDGFQPRPITIGITPVGGLVVRAETDLWDRICKDVPINPDNQPALLFGELRDARHTDYLRNHKANILYNASGILQHGAVKAFRSADVSVLFPPAVINHPRIEQRDWVRIISDGYNAQIQNLGKNLS